MITVLLFFFLLVEGGGVGEITSGYSKEHNGIRDPLDILGFEFSCTFYKRNQFKTLKANLTG